jgi:hypothetical protein
VSISSFIDGRIILIGTRNALQSIGMAPKPESGDAAKEGKEKEKTEVLP